MMRAFLILLVVGLVFSGTVASSAEQEVKYGCLVVNGDAASVDVVVERLEGIDLRGVDLNGCELSEAVFAINKLAVGGKAVERLVL